VSWRLVARKDVADAIRQYHLHLTGVVAVLLFGGTAYVTSRTFEGIGAPPGAVAGALATLGTFLVPLLAAGFSQGDVVGMRERGDLKLLLGLPFARRDVILGSVAGRTVVVWASVLFGVGAATLVALARGANVAFDFLLFATGMIGVIGAVFVAIAIGISASVSTETRAGALAIAAYFLFVFQLWNAIPMAALWAVNGFALPPSSPTWVDVVINCNPVLALWNVFAAVLPGNPSFVARLPSTPPVYRTVPFAVGVLAAWLVGPVALGARRFDRTDL